MIPSWQQVRPPLSVLAALIVALGILAVESNAQDVDLFDSPLMPLPPQLLNDVGRESLELGDTPEEPLPALPALDAADKQAFLEPELSRLRDLMKKLSEADKEQATAIESALRKSIQQQTDNAQKQLEAARVTAFETRHGFDRPRFELAERLIADLQERNVAPKATRELNSQTKRYKAAFDVRSLPESHADRGALPNDHAIEVHHVSVEGAATTRHPTVDIQVTHTAHPVILLLSARAPLSWKIATADKTNIFAIVVDSSRPQQIEGVGDAMVIRSGEFPRLPATMFPNSQSSSAKSQIQDLKSRAVTLYRPKTLSSSPIVIGPTKGTWLNAYVTSQVEDCISELRHHRHLAQAKALSDLNYDAVFVQSYGNRLDAASGSFNIRGPIASTLAPLPHPNLIAHVVTEDEMRPRAYGLTFDGKFVAISDGGLQPALTEVDQGPVTTPKKFVALAYDRIEQRLILAANAPSQTELLAYSLRANTWQLLKTLPDASILAVSMHETNEITSVVFDSKQKNLQFITFDLDGSIVTRTELRDRVGELRPSPLAHAQLVESNGLAILVGNRETKPHNMALQVQAKNQSPQTRRPGMRPAQSQTVLPRFGKQVAEVYVFEPSSGELHYQNELKINDGSDAQFGTSMQRNAPSNLLVDLHRQFRAATQLLPETENPHASSEFRAQLEDVETALFGERSRTRLPHLHVVARYSSPQPVRVKLTDQRGPLTLVLCGNHRLQWTVEVARGVKLERILLGGLLPQSLTSLPPNVKVETHFNEDDLTIHDARDRSKLLRFEARIDELTGLPVSSYSIANQSSGLVLIGPENDAWRLQTAKYELDGLLNKLVRPNDAQSTPNEQGFSHLRFHAMHQGPLPTGFRESLSGSESPTDQPKQDIEVHWAEFSVRGPLIGKGTPVQRNVRFGIADSSNQRLFTGTMSSIALDDRLQSLGLQSKLLANSTSVGHIAGVGFDERRQRLFVCGSRGLFTCSFPNLDWAKLRELNGLTRTGFAYSNEDEIAYTIRSRSRGAIHSLERFNGRGVPLPPLVLSRPITLGTPYSYGYANIQLIALDGYVALLRYQHQYNQRLPGGGRLRKEPAGRLSLIKIGESLDDVGEVVWESVVRPSLVFREISGEELNTFWQELDDVETKTPSKMDSMLWTLAAGGESTLAFLKSKFKVDDPPLPDESISQLVNELDSDRFVIRERALNQLQTSNSQIAPLLRAALAASSSQEVHDRLQHILRIWASGVPQTAEDLRLVRAVDVLGRMDLKQSDDFLLTLTESEFPTIVRFHARRVSSLRAKVAPAGFENPALRLQQKLFVPRAAKAD